MSSVSLLAGAILASLVMYSLLAGADYGAGLWDLLCHGPRQSEQRHLIEQAIGPVWEANHVWLILTIVLLFSGFPDAFGALCVGLAIPLFLVLLGIVLRGCSFVFRSYFTGERRTQLYWGKVFSISSSMTPLFLGILIGSISCDSVIIHGGVSENGFLKTWLLPFPLSVGILAVSLFAYLSACYLAVDAGNAELRDDFRLRGLIAGLVSIAMAVITYVIAGSSAVGIREELSNRPVAWLIEVCALGSMIVAFRGLLLRRYQQARIAAAIQVALIVVGWGIAQYPYLIRPGITIANSAAPRNVAAAIDVALGCGAIVLIPSLTMLFAIFKGTRGVTQQEQAGD
ncbi:MAG TPA: cytochrome d ubiquinol oxidase subunit II [Terracidiphilus sp.]|nr:cytochrome d ubiquinol oxidase subunit II [Terracidiphilus sp.]